MTAAPVVAARGSVVIWEVRRVIAASLPQVVLFPLINRFLREKRLIDLILFTVSGDSGQTVPGSYGSANTWPGIHSLPRCLGLHQTSGAVGACSVPLPSLLFWLSRPKGSNLVEATIPAEEVRTTSTCRSMAIAVFEEMLYKDKCPLVGVGLVYTPPYLPQVPFSVAYMNLCEWRDAHEASENRLVGIRLMFIHASEASGFLPVAEGHPVLLDASAMEVLGDIETSVLPLSLRGFQLHSVGPTRRWEQGS